MIVKARFNTGIDALKIMIANYIALNGNVNFLVQPYIDKSKTEVIGEHNELMFLIGYVAGIGEHSLEYFTSI
jgi:hypothetical protein